MIGAFVFGMSMPKGEVESSIVDRVEGFVSGILMPVFFAVVGHRVDVYGIANGLPWAMVGLVVVLACLAKVLSTVFAGYLCGMKCKEAATLGVVMNTKSLLALLILEVGIEQKVFSLVLLICSLKLISSIDQISLLIFAILSSHACVHLLIMIHIAYFSAGSNNPDLYGNGGCGVGNDNDRYAHHFSNSK